MTSRAIFLSSPLARLSIGLCSWFFAMALALAAETAAPIEYMEVEQPREFGYQLGDRFERRIRLRLRHPYELVLDSLPTPGRLNRWIAFHSHELERRTLGSADDYEITLRYQVVNVDPSAADAAIPGHELEVRHADETLTFLIRPARTVITPFAEALSNELAPDIAPDALPGRLEDVALSGAILTASLMILSWLHFGWFKGRRTNPFTRAHRLLRGYRRDPLSDEEYAAALRSLHEAFNLTAGHALFPEQLDEFFEDHPGFARIETGIVDYFSRSNAYFFADSHERLTLAELVAFARQCRDIERGLA